MKGLKCELCNEGNLIMDEYGRFAYCEICGTKYKKETLQPKIDKLVREAREDKSQELERVFYLRRADGVCLYCGGTFKGLFKKVCSNCGKPKNY